MRSTFRPQLFTILKQGYSKKNFLSDSTSGIITGIVALPLAIAFGIASGATPEQGVFTAIIAGFLISALSGSKFQIGGPTGAFIVLIYDTIQKHGFDGLIIATIIAGIIILLMGVFKLGDIIKFIPYPVTVGFTGGIAVIIATSQIKNLIGLSKDANIFGNINDTNIYAILIAILSIFLIKFWGKISSKIPGSLIAIIICTIVVYIFNIPIETIGTQFGELNNNFPKFQIPNLNLDKIIAVFPSAVAIAILGAIESLLSALVADGMTGEKHRSNTELMAQGITNIITPFFGGLPATGAIARTATNIKNGAKTPISGIIHALVLLLIIIFLGSLAKYIPMTVLATILIIVAINMSEYRIFIKMFKAPKSDIIVLLVTFLSTVLIDLAFAIQIGMIISFFLFIKRMENVFDARKIELIEDEERKESFEIPKGVDIFEINGPFFFGAAMKLQDSFESIHEFPKVLILRMRNVSAIDATGLFAIEDIYKKAVANKTTLIISGIHTQPLNVIKKSGLYKLIGENNIYKDIFSAIKEAKNIVKN